MINFKTYLAESQSEEQAAKLVQAKIKELSRPEAVEQMVKQLGAKDIDDLIRKLEDKEEVKRVFREFERIKDQKMESWVGKAISGVWDVLTSLVGGALKLVGNTLLRMFSGMGSAFNAPRSTPMTKITYAGVLLMTAGLSGVLLAHGAVGPALVPWALWWFGWNVIERISPGGGFKPVSI